MKNLNDGLESKNVFKHMYEINSRDLVLNDDPTDGGCVQGLQAKNERNYQPSVERGSRSLSQMPCRSRSSRSRSSVALVVLS